MLGGILKHTWHFISSEKTKDGLETDDLGY